MVPYDKKLIGNPKTGVVHGGVITALLDNACGVAVGTSLTTPTSIATLDLRIDYMKPAEAGLDIYATAEAIKNTKSVAFVRAIAFVEGREDDPIALASGSFMLAANRAPSPRLMDIFQQLGDARDALDEDRDPGLDARALIEAVPYIALLGIKVDLKDGVVETHMPFREHLIGNPALPALHGGTIGSFLEITAVMELLWRSKLEILPRTVNLTIDYLRSGRPQDLYGRAHITKLGRRVASVRVECWQDNPEKLTASAHGNFLMTDRLDQAENG
ncbi:unnamed protein product [Symbiodinium microadriaticum]|nr:unnamed protein product [Symbiodinium microadriaticum]